MHPRELKWSKSEKEIARRAFDAAYERECEEIRFKVRQMIENGSGPQSLWRIHDYLSERRRETDQKYDYRYSVLSSVFARLIRDGWLEEAELEGLGEEKMAFIRRLADFGDCIDVAMRQARTRACRRSKARSAFSEWHWW